MVEIDLNHRERKRLLATGFRQQFCAVEQRAAIIQPGKRIMPGLPLERVLKRVHVTHHAADHQPRDQQHGGKERPHQRQHDTDAAEVVLYPFVQGVDPQDNAVEVIESFPAHKTASEADPAAGGVLNRLRNLRRFAFVKMVNRVFRMGRGGNHIEPGIVQLILPFRSVFRRIGQQTLHGAQRKIHRHDAIPVMVEIDGNAGGDHTFIIGPG